MYNHTYLPSIRRSSAADRNSSTLPSAATLAKARLRDDGFEFFFLLLGFFL